MSQLSTLAAIIAHPFAGNFGSDRNAVMAVYKFVENESNTMPDRAAALRHLAVAAFGFDGEDAGQGVTDSDYIAEYMASR
jgi:hypothetical protein